ncbi:MULTISPECIES: alanine dehydrogenase [Mesoflavibacter]|uniref:alanine dehydrogenase n=1 Tax=Mesoflavibacter zeaxanthinifaciens subsp. sabulilitoris TaxID=1520893 RepID=A0A2T1NGQ3_9FLAO|nr:MULTISPECIES: alanine dehydrogenase [Mesoflavibacter]MBB3122910.1 alanine dehydrogenase [Mesoflavibacter zeaxanthinifaciens subsp. sabulilitoris]MCP4054474.1 alanine dehydrogenase [Mesoflavibacter sp.]PSG92014.1 alanine dehydrogenase [Mesoflavibacter zeaxanthinifaciens subsp. sabulilitoris]UAB75192.1 alanine dehydrogenase [Mesoflavibacter sp. SCSIO 43206]
MSKSITPFSKAQLIPQEETLEIYKHKSELFIGIPKETAFQEKRVCLTPDAVSAIVNNGHRVLIESEAGLGANFSDKDYSEAGAEITKDTAKVYSCPMILKVEPPTLEELDLINPQATLISALQIKTQTKKYFEKLAAKRITALAFEFIKDDVGAYPAVRALSEIAGTASVLIASELLSSSSQGNGLMFGNISGVPPTEVVILGAGTVGEFAARSAIGLGANVKVFDNSITKLRCLQTNLNRTIYTSTIQPKYLSKALKRCDVVIGAVRGKDRSPIIVTEAMVENMKKGSVIIDVSIDMGGCFETSEITSHNKPTFRKHDVIHYCVPNIPARYSRTASASISNIFTPYLLKIADDGGLEHAIRFDKGLKNGLYFYHGILTSRAVGEWFDLKHSDINLLIF